MSPSARKLIAEGFAKPKEAASYLGVGKDVVYDLVRDGALSHIRLGRRVSIPWVSLREYAAILLRHGSES